MVLRGSRSNLVQRGINSRKCRDLSLRRNLPTHPQRFPLASNPPDQGNGSFSAPTAGPAWLRLLSSHQRFLLFVSSFNHFLQQPRFYRSSCFIFLLQDAAPCLIESLQGDFARALAKGICSSRTEPTLNTGKSPQNPILSEGSKIRAHRRCSTSQLAPRLKAWADPGHY